MTENRVLRKVAAGADETVGRAAANAGGRNRPVFEALDIVEDLRGLARGLMLADRMAREIDRSGETVYDKETDFDDALATMTSGAIVIIEAALERLDVVLRRNLLRAPSDPVHLAAKPAAAKNAPDAGQFAAMVAAWEAAADEESVLTGGDPASEAAGARTGRAYDALVLARPTDPAAMALQLRWLASQIEGGVGPDDAGILEHIADQLSSAAPARAA